jgi:hypothetical protein
MLAFLVADRVDKQDQERRAGQIPVVLPGDARVANDAVNGVHIRSA